MPESHLVFPELPTEEYPAARKLAGKIDEASVETLEHHAELGELGHVSVYVLGETCRLFLKSFSGFVRVLGTRPESRNLEFTYDILPSPVVAHSITNDAAYERQHLVCFVDCKYALHLREDNIKGELSVMKDFHGERILMRVHIGESDQHRGKHLHTAILDMLRARGCAGATVFRGAMSYGSTSVVHTDSIEVMSLDLPIIVECVDSEEKIDEILPELDEMVQGGLITLEKVEVIAYRHHESQSA